MCNGLIRCGEENCVCTYVRMCLHQVTVVNITCIPCSILYSSGFCVLSLLHFRTSTCDCRDTCAVVLRWPRPQLTGGNGCSANADSNAVFVWKPVCQTEVRNNIDLIQSTLVVRGPDQQCLLHLHRHRSAQYTDGRVKVMNQVISGIRVIKMYGWEYAFKELVVGIRKWVQCGVV